MEAQQFVIRFDGAGANEHTLGMRQLGECLIGVERLITVGLFALESGRYPKRNESLPLLVRASEPRAGSYEIAAILGPGAAFLPLLHEFFITGATEILWHWMSGALLKMGGRQQDAENHFSELIRLLDNKDARQHSLLESMDARRHLEVLEWQRLVLEACRVVSPVGPSCDRILLPMDGETTEIDFPTAQAIRSKGKLEVGDMKTFKIKVDGFTHHNKQLKLVHPSEPGRFITGHVRDPAFEIAPNIYTDAATKQSWLSVKAKPTVKDGRIQALYIMDGSEIEGDGQ